MCWLLSGLPLCLFAPAKRASQSVDYCAKPPLQAPSRRRVSPSRTAVASPIIIIITTTTLDWY